ncbi:cytochrome c oxidase assembly protein [Roseovarius pelagicus]|uniref:Cytochrome c oxidase assembly protein n=1 Tax=Roseovarius pelagicus TaxID=2980108 RepID=A0ABY6DF91_9RHOB|nr:cytochrome c oxidase assembly protein [Roseovarius pelagicus]UXX84769.1 cytochrome c oxidase assembly protein [Roseovarius pelagicus]
MSNDFWNRIYCGPPPDPPDLWSSWNFDPAVLGGLLVLTVFTGRDRFGLAALLVLAVAFVSPLCALSSSLFSARVVHHVLLTAVAAPLLAMCWPSSRAGPIMAPFVVSTVVFWFWHAPAAYDSALSHVGVYWLMQLSLLASAAWFWRAVLGPAQSPVDALTFVILGFAQMGLLGALLTFTPEPLYAAHMLAPYQWGLSPLEDQQLGGLLMWIPAALPFAVAGFAAARRGSAQIRGGAS